MASWRALWPRPRRPWCRRPRRATRTAPTFEGDQATVEAVHEGQRLETEEQSPAVADALIVQLGTADIAVQGQIVGQANLSAQRGAAIAIAEADEDSVTSWNDPAGGNDIVATSSAIAEGPVVQTAEQSNENSAKATFEGSQADAVAEAQDDGGVVASAGQFDGFDVALSRGGAGIWGAT